MQPSATSVEILESAPSAAPGTGRQRRMIGTLGATVLIGVGVAAAAGGTDRVPMSSEAAFVDIWIDAWNDRDAQTVSAMTCRYVSVFVPAGVIQDQLDRVAEDRPIVGDHVVESTGTAVLGGREYARMSVRYVPATGGAARERYVYVRERDDGEMCIGSFTAW